MASNCTFCDTHGCEGCKVPVDATELPWLKHPEEHTLTIHWRKWMQRHYYDVNEAKSVTVHQSVYNNRLAKKETQNIDI